MDAAADDCSTSPIPILRRRNSTGTPTLPTKPYHSPSSSITTTTTATSASCSSSSADFDLIAIKAPCYTSLRDILPSSATHVQSPRAPYSAADSGYEISIRNPLVKHAAWAYLQPMSTSPESDGTTVLHRLWSQISSSVFRFITAAFDCLLQISQL